MPERRRPQWGGGASPLIQSPSGTEASQRHRKKSLPPSAASLGLRQEKKAQRASLLAGPAAPTWLGEQPLSVTPALFSQRRILKTPTLQPSAPGLDAASLLRDGGEAQADSGGKRRESSRGVALSPQDSSVNR